MRIHNARNKTRPKNSLLAIISLAKYFDGPAHQHHTKYRNASNCESRITTRVCTSFASALYGVLVSARACACPACRKRFSDDVRSHTTHAHSRHDDTGEMCGCRFVVVAFDVPETANTTPCMCRHSFGQNERDRELLGMDLRVCERAASVGQTSAERPQNRRSLVSSSSATSATAAAAM